MDTHNKDIIYCTCADILYICTCIERSSRFPPLPAAQSVRALSADSAAELSLFLCSSFNFDFYSHQTLNITHVKSDKWICIIYIHSIIDTNENARHIP